MKLKFLASALAAAALGAGCAQNSGTSSIGQAESQNAGAALAAGIEDGAAGYGQVNSGAAVVPSCITLSGDTSDPDGDSIPTSATLTFNCMQQQLGYTGTLTGTESVMDSEPTTLAWAFTANADLSAALVGPGGGSITTNRSGEIVASQSSATGPFQLERTLAVSTEFKAAGGASVTVDENDTWTLGFTPTGSWSAGLVITGGTLTATGSWDVTVGDAEADATLATPTPLTLDATCGTRITAGSVTGSWTGGGHGNTITVTWTGCGTSTVAYAPR